VFSQNRSDILCTQNIKVRAMLKSDRTNVLLHSTAAIGALIRSRRKELALTQKQLSELTGLSLAFVNGIENGKETAEIGKALQLLAALGIDLQGRVR
jgi:HTH-type transcriptional regulator / antitoxin HipB